MSPPFSVDTRSSLAHLQPTALFIDGVFALDGANVINIQDLERVEIIKGPQSAFFGRNTFAGAINYITKTPSLEDFEMEVDASAETYDQFETSLMASIPIVDGKWALQVNTRLYSRGGQWTATDGGKLGSESSSSISGVVYGERSDRLSVKLRAYYQKDNDGPAARAFISGQMADRCSGKSVQGLDNDGNSTTLTPQFFICGKLPELGAPGTRPISSETSLRPSLFATTRFFFNSITQTGSVTSAPDLLITDLIQQQYIAGVPELKGYGINRNNIRLSANVDYEFKNGYAVTLLGGYNDMETNFVIDFDQTDVQSWYVNDPKTGEDFSAEIRLLSPQEEKLRWLVGATYYDQEFITHGGGGYAITACFNFFGIPGGPCGAGPGIFTLPLTSGDEAKVWGIYASASYDISDQFTIDVEGRYLEDERTTGLQAGAEILQNIETYKQWTPRIIVSYQPADDTNFYLQASRGALPGRVNGLIAICSDGEFLVPWVSTVTGMPSTASECQQFQDALGGELIGSTPSQRLNAVELGWKQVLQDGRFRFNLTG